MANNKSKWTWAKDVQAPPDLTQQQLLEAYSLAGKLCSKGKHRPCKNNIRCVSAIIDKFWSSDESPKSKNESRLKGKIPYAGLRNAGALCYCNVFLQLWYHNPRFREAIYNWHPILDGGMTPEMFNPSSGVYEPDPSLLLGQLQLIFAEMEFGNAKIVDPIKLAEALNLNQNTHQDPQEFATLFLNCKEYIVKNITEKLFTMNYNSIIICNECKTKNITGQSMINFQLPLTSKQQTVIDIVNTTLEGEKLEGDNQYNCHTCQKKCDAVKKMEITALPPTCVFQVLRSEFNKEKKRIVKLKTYLEIPQELDLSPYLSDSTTSTHSKYELSAVVVHLGSECSGGHYIVNIKDPASSKWFSFNDTEVESMKTDCLVEGGKSGKTSKVFPNSLLSNCAYMLVYDSVDQQDVVPMLPSWLDPNITLRNLELDKEDGLLKSEDMLRTEQWTCNKEYMNGMAEKINPDPGSSSSGDFVPTKWLTAWAENPQNKVKIENDSLLCPHKKLAFNKVFSARVISKEVADQLYDQYSGGPRLSLPQCLCEDCISTQCSLLQLHEAIEKDWKIIAHELKQVRRNDTQPTEGFWVSKTSFNKWRGYAKARIERQLVMTEEPTVDNEDEPMETETEESAQDSMPNSKCNSSVSDEEDPIPCKSPKISEEEDVKSKDSTAYAEPQDDTKMNGYMEEPEFVFNADLLCDHGHFSTNESVRKLVPEKVWTKLKAYFPNAHTFEFSDSCCELCQSRDSVQSQDQESKVEIAKLIKDRMPALVAFPNTQNNSNKHVRFETQAYRPDTLYVLSFDFAQELSKFVKNPTKVSRPTLINNQSLICKHGMVHVDLGMNGSYDIMENDKSFFVLVEPDEWEFLIMNFEVDTRICLQTSHSMDSHDTVSPDVCTNCLMQRKRISNFNYHNSYIFVRRTDGSKQDSSKGQGRSRRNGRKQKDDFELRVNASDTIRSLKSQIMKKLNNGCTFSDLHLTTNIDGGRYLDDLDATLADCEICANSTIYLKEDKVGDGNSDDDYASAMLVDPEQGFLGTILAQQ